MFNINLAPKWCFDVDINSSVDPKIRKASELRQCSGLMTKWSKERGVGSFGAKASCQFPVWERYPFLELSSIQMSEPNNRPTVRNLIKAKSQTSSLIYQRCQLSFIAKCVSLSHAVCGCWSILSSVSINTRTHTHSISLSVSPLPCSLSPSFRFA